MLRRFAVDITINPSADGMPGAALIGKLLGWLMMAALWGSVAAILIGAAIYGLARESGAYDQARRGRNMAIGGAVGAILAGLATTIVELLFAAARS